MLIPTFGGHLLKFRVEIKKLEKPRWAKWNSFCWLLQWTSMNGRQIFSIHIVLKYQRSSEAQFFARLQHFCTFVIEIKDRMQYCMEESKRGCRARALGIDTRLLYALRAALRAARAGVIMALWEWHWFIHILEQVQLPCQSLACLVSTATESLQGCLVEFQCFVVEVGPETS